MTTSGLIGHLWPLAQNKKIHADNDMIAGKKISVSIKFSHRCPTMLAKEDITYVASPSRDDETNPSSMKRKAAQFKRYARDESNLVDAGKIKNAMKEMNKKCMKYKASIEHVVNIRADAKIDNLISTQEETVKKLKRKQYYLQKKNNDLMKELNANNLSFFVNKILKGMHFGKRAALILDMVVSGELFGEGGKDERINFVRKEVRKVFTAWRLCKAKDTAHQGCLNLQGIEAVRRTQELEKGEQGFIASKSAIWREGDELLRAVGYPMFKPTHEDKELGEIFSFDFEMVIRFMLEANTLTKIASLSSVEVLFTLDFAALTQGTGHIFGACRNVDTRSKKNRALIYVEEDENGRTRLKSLQSNHNVYPMIMVYCRDGKEPYRIFLKIGLLSFIRSRRMVFLSEMSVILH